MALRSPYLFIASMDVETAHEALFNEVYDTEHVPELNNVPGVLGVTRYQLAPAAVRVGGERRELASDGDPLYHAIYELESPDVLLSDAWAQAVERGRWPGQVRPHTRNRRHRFGKILP